MIYIVYGAPCSGKTTYIKKNKKEGDIVFEFDKIKEVLSGKFREEDEELQDSILKLRDKIIYDYKRNKIKDRDLYISCIRASKSLLDQLKGVHYQLIEMQATIEVCRERLKEDPDGRDIKKTKELINKYFIKEKFDTSFYKTKAWQQARDFALISTKYLCWRCKRHGVLKDATEVHHVNLSSLRPDLKLDQRNLIPLCHECHLKMHDHLHTSLSAEGERIRKEINLERNIKEI